MVKTRSSAAKTASSTAAAVATAAAAAAAVATASAVATARRAIGRNDRRRLRRPNAVVAAVGNEDNPERNSHALVRKYLECPVCFETFRGKIFMCDNGHNQCERCFYLGWRALTNGELRCPFGRCRYTKFPLRNYLVEQLIEGSKILLDCPYTGCRKRMTREPLEVHIKACKFEAIACPAAHDNNNCGGKITRSSFYLHFLIHHPPPDGVINIPVHGRWWGLHRQQPPFGTGGSIHYFVRVIKTETHIRVDALADVRDDPRFGDLRVNVELTHPGFPPTNYQASLKDIQAPGMGVLVRPVCMNMGVRCTLVSKTAFENEDDESSDDYD